MKRNEGTSPYYNNKADRQAALTTDHGAALIPLFACECLVVQAPCTFQAE